MIRFPVVVASLLLASSQLAATALQAQGDAIERVRIETAGAPGWGPVSAPVTLVEFIDYQCPFCEKAHGTIDGLVERYGEKVRVVVVQNPLAMHPDAPLAARAALAAGEQGRFREMHGLLLKNRTALKRPDILRHAATVGLDAAAFEKALDDPKLEARVKADTALAAKVGATATPFFFVNGRAVRGAQPAEVFAAIIDEEVAGTTRPTRFVDSASKPQPPTVTAQPAQTAQSAQAQGPAQTQGGDATARALQELTREVRALRAELAEVRQAVGLPTKAPQPPAGSPTPPASVTAPPAGAPIPPAGVAGPQGRDAAPKAAQGAVAEKAPRAAAPVQAAGDWRLDTERILGPASAKVAILEFSELQCPFCRQYHQQTFPRIKEQYIATGKIRYSFRDFPLASHTAAPAGAVAIRCAGQQGRFWEMLEALFASGGALGPDLYAATAGKLGLDAAQFRTCTADPQMARRVEEDRASAERAGVQATPHFVIGRLEGERLVDVRPLTGAHSFEAFSAIVEELLAPRQ